MTITDPDASKNAWRIGSPGVEGWTRTARPGDPDKYFMVSADCHVTESLAFLETHRARVPRPHPARRGTRDDGAAVPDHRGQPARSS